MSAPSARFDGLLTRARLQGFFHALLLALPWLLLAGWWQVTHPGSVPARSGLVAALLLFALLAWRAWRALDQRWLVRTLDHTRPDMEDSSALLLRDPSSLPALQQLQRERLRQRLATRPALVRERLPLRLLMANTGAAVLIGLLAFNWPSISRATGLSVGLAQHAAEQPAAQPVLIAQRVVVQPPAYTGLPAQAQDGLDIKAIVGSGVRWELRFDPQPTSVTLEFADGRRIPARRSGNAWTADAVATSAALYRIVTQPALSDKQSQLHRIEVLDDQPPEVRNIVPEATLTMMTPGQRSWSVVFEATDDFGVAADATLRIIQTQGEGENITFKEHSIRIGSSGPATRRRFAHGFDLRQSGITVGNDLIAQLIIRDLRSPDPHVVRSAGVILRWPPERGMESSGLDGLMKRALPTYLRSQRQIIMDTEKLLAQRRQFSDEEFRQKSDAIGLDQHALRLRYGQFMGEEDEGGPERPTGTPHDASAAPPKPKLPALPTNDVDDEPTPDIAQEEQHHDGDGHDHDHTAEADTAHDGHDAHAGHDHGAGLPPNAPPDPFKQAEAMAAEGAHVHDLPEAATLLDPQTREILRLALRAMWSAEGALRSGQPSDALPFERKALEYIKKAQQAERVYLPRMGTELPPIDDSRRMTGKRDGLAPRQSTLTAAERKPEDRAIFDLWTTLASGNPAPPALMTRALAALQRAGGSREALDAITAFDRVQRDAQCGDCRAALRDALWPLLPRRTPSPSPRARNTAEADAWLDAVERAR